MISTSSFVKVLDEPDDDKNSTIMSNNNLNNIDNDNNEFYNNQKSQHQQQKQQRQYQQQQDDIYKEEMEKKSRDLSNNSKIKGNTIARNNILYTSMITKKDCKICMAIYNRQTHCIILNLGLFHKYTSSQDYFYTKDINTIINKRRKPIYIMYQDLLIYDEEKEYMKRFYKRSDSLMIMNEIQEFYTKFKDYPRNFHSPFNNILGLNIRKHRRLEYLKVFKAYQSDEIKSEKDQDDKKIINSFNLLEELGPSFFNNKHNNNNIEDASNVAITKETDDKNQENNKKILKHQRNDSFANEVKTNFQILKNIGKNEKEPNHTPRHNEPPVVNFQQGLFPVVNFQQGLFSRHDSETATNELAELIKFLSIEPKKTNVLRDHNQKKGMTKQGHGSISTQYQPNQNQYQHHNHVIQPLNPSSINHEFKTEPSPTSLVPKMDHGRRKGRENIHYIEDEYPKKNINDEPINPYTSPVHAENIITKNKSKSPKTKTKSSSNIQKMMGSNNFHPVVNSNFDAEEIQISEEKKERAASMMSKNIKNKYSPSPCREIKKDKMSLAEVQYSSKDILTTQNNPNWNAIRLDLNGIKSNNNQSREIYTDRSMNKNYQGHITQNPTQNITRTASSMLIHANNPQNKANQVLDMQYLNTYDDVILKRYEFSKSKDKLLKEQQSELSNTHSNPSLRGSLKYLLLDKQSGSGILNKYMLKNSYRTDHKQLCKMPSVPKNGSCKDLSTTPIQNIYASPMKMITNNTVNYRHGSAKNHYHPDSLRSSSTKKIVGKTENGAEIKSRVGITNASMIGNGVNDSLRKITVDHPTKIYLDNLSIEYAASKHTTHDHKKNNISQSTTQGNHYLVSKSKHNSLSPNKTRLYSSQRNYQQFDDFVNVFFS